MTRLLLAILATTLCSLLAQTAHAEDSGYSAEEQANLAVVQGMFEAFDSGNTDAFFGALADDIEWTENGSSDFVPFHTTVHGVAAVRDWFGQVLGAFESESMEVLDVLADGDTVVVVAHESGHAVSTGKPYDENMAMFFTLANGKVVKYFGFDDSAQEAWAMSPDEAH